MFQLAEGRDPHRFQLHLEILTMMTREIKLSAPISRKRAIRGAMIPFSE